MAGLAITDSSNITLLDSRIFVNVCDGEFIIDSSPSAFLGSGASNVLGIKVQITNPYGVVIKPFAGSYDIAAPLTATYTYDIPTQAGKLQYGIYKIEVKLVDDDNTEYTVSKNVNVCTYTSDSHPCDERVRMLADCVNGTVTFQLAEPPTFKGKFADSKVQSVRIDYPTASGLPHIDTTAPNFSMALFQGVYKATVSVCATYNMGDNVFLQLPYNVTMEKNVKCLLDYNCIWPAIKKMNDQLEVCSSQKEKEALTLKVLDALRLLKTAELANAAGADSSDYIHDLEELLGCQCTCDCSASPIINNTPATSISIEGCLFEKTTVGLTDVYTFNGKNYFLTVEDNSILGISDVYDYGCTIYQQFTFSIEGAYNAIKSQVNNSTEYNFWAAVINNTLNSIDATCLGFNSVQWAALTFAQKFAALKNIACNGGAACSAAISGVNAASSGADVILTFTQTNGFSADIYVYGILKGNVIAGVGTFTLAGYADGANHSYVIVPKCTNGSNGTSATGTFGFLACPFISPPSITDSTINNATCPYDLTTLVYPTPPLGIEVEWHTANNTLSSSLVADPENVSSGVYYAFAKDSNGCYSTASVVTLVCDTGASCTAPQSLLVENSVGGFKVSFLSANYPPPLNSYTVKRKAFADPDVDGSYTTIGTPTYNSSTSRWEITDATAVDNTLYTYKAQSNCTSTTPYVLYTFANIDCPVVTLTPSDTEMDYSFPPVGGEVDKYEVSIYDSTGAVLLSTQTILPSFSNPVTGTFTYLTEGTTYQVRVVVFIGTYSKTCSFSAEATTGGDPIAGFISNSTVASITGATFDLVAPTHTGGTNFPIGTSQSGNFETEETGSNVSVAVAITGVFTSVFLQDTLGAGHNQLYAGAGTYTFNNIPILPGGGGWFIQVN